MKWKDVQTDWLNYRETIREKWTEITDEDIDGINGDRALLEERIVERYGKSPEEAKADIENWLNISRIQGRS